MPIPSSGDTPSVAAADSASSSSIKGEGLIFPTPAEACSSDFAPAFVVECSSKEEEEEEEDKEEIESMPLSPPSSSSYLLGVDPPLPSISSMIPTVDEIDGNGDANSVTPRKKMTKAAAPPPRLLPLRVPLVVVLLLIVRVLVLYFCIFLFVCLFVCFRRGNEYLKAYSSERAKTLLFPGVMHLCARSSQPVSL